MVESPTREVLSLNSPTLTFHGMNSLVASPDQIHALMQSTYLDLSNNMLNGSIPDQIGDLTQLVFFDLSWNELSGPIPEDIGNLYELVDLDLEH